MNSVMKSVGRDVADALLKETSSLFDFMPHVSMT